MVLPGSQTKASPRIKPARPAPPAPPAPKVKKKNKQIMIQWMQELCCFFLRVCFCVYCLIDCVEQTHERIMLSVLS